MSPKKGSKQNATQNQIDILPHPNQEDTAVKRVSIPAFAGQVPS
jgi:hypothetical protein